jgi:tetratricopeptide (TPR) repeat protein
MLSCIRIGSVSLLFATLLVLPLQAQNSEQVEVGPPPMHRVDPPVPGVSPEALEKRGDELRTDKNYLDADAYNNLGVIYYQAHAYSAAIKNYEKAISLKSDAASYYSNMGASYFGKKEFDKAIQSYAKAMDLDPEIFERTTRAGVLAQLSSPEDRAHYDYVLAKLYARTGSSERSLHYLKKAMEEGYKDIKNVYKDEEFSTLRKDPRFAELMASKTLAIPD